MKSQFKKISQHDKAAFKFIKLLLFWGGKFIKIVNKSQLEKITIGEVCIAAFIFNDEEV